MRQVPSEIHFRSDELAVFCRMHLAIPERLAVLGMILVDDIGALTFLRPADEFKARDLLAVGPATVEIGCPAQRVVERAREAIILVNEALNRITVYADVDVKASADDGKGS